MAYDAHANLVDTTVQSAPAPSTSGTSLVLASGAGSWFPATPPYNITIGPSTGLLTRANSEILRVTSRSTDTLTVARAQEGTSARSVQAGDRVMLPPTAKTLTDVETVADAASSSATAATDAAAAAQASADAANNAINALQTTVLPVGQTRPSGLGANDVWIQVNF